MLPQICSWCFEKGVLTILNDATWEQAMDALAENTLSHGICVACAEPIREQIRAQVREQIG